MSKLGSPCFKVSPKFLSETIGADVHKTVLKWQSYQI